MGLEPKNQLLLEGAIVSQASLTNFLGDTKKLISGRTGINFEDAIGIKIQLWIFFVLAISFDFSPCGKQKQIFNPQKQQNRLKNITNRLKILIGHSWINCISFAFFQILSSDTWSGEIEKEELINHINKATERSRNIPPTFTASLKKAIVDLPLRFCLLERIGK